MESSTYSPPASPCREGNNGYGNNFISSIGPFDQLPHWFVGITGVLYLTGFLIVSWYLGRLGIKEAGGDPLKLNFIEVGLLFNLPYVLIVFPTIIVLELLRARAKHMRAFYARHCSEIARWKIAEYYIKAASVYIAVVLYFSVFIVFLYFTPHNFFKLNSSAISLFSLLAVASLVIFVPFGTQFDKHHREVKEHDYVLKVNFGYTVTTIFIRTIPLFVCCFGFAYYVYPVTEFWEVLLVVAERDGAEYFLAFMILFVLLYVTLNYVLSSNMHKENRNLRFLVVGFVACIAGTMYYYSAIAFAANIFPFIPAYRGGGDYAATSSATLWFGSNAKDKPFYELPEEILDEDNNNVSRKMLIVYDTPTSIYMTIDRCDLSVLSRDVDVAPNIFSVRKDIVAGIKYTERTPCFSLGEFSSRAQFDYFCQLVAPLHTDAADASITSLNDMLKNKDLFDAVRKFKKNVAKDARISKLAIYTSGLRSSEYSTLMPFQRQIIQCFNRRLLEVAFPNYCPRSDYVNMFMSTLKIP